MTTRVVATVDIRAFPLEIAEHMLSLGKSLNMGLGVVSYNEAEIKLEIWLQVLSDYREMFFEIPILVNQKHSVVRFIQLHTNNPNLHASVARQLLDFMGYFPYTEKVLDND